MPRFAFIICVLLAASAVAQQTRLGAELEKEGSNVADSCGGLSFGHLASCAEVLFTGHPLHIAVGSLAPQNGFGAGGAFVYHWTPLNWRNSLDADAVASSNGSWRAGSYLTLVHIHRPKIVITPGGASSGSPTKVPKSNLAIREQAIFHVYAENTSLNKLTFFGIGPNTVDTARSYFGMSEAIAGGNVVWPVWQKLNLALIGEANGRFVDLRGSHGQSSPSIEQLYAPASVPGLANQPGYVQFGQGVRIRPEFGAGFVRLNYLVTFREYVAPGNSKFSFERLAVDLQHQFPLYKTTRALLPKDANGPDDCSEDAVGKQTSCAPIVLPTPPGATRNLEGSFAIRFIMNASFVPSGNVVPFYFQPTLGGSDIDGTPALGSYQDYRFRAPNTILARASFEHSIYNKVPLGVTAMIDEGKVALTRGDLDFTHLRHTYSAGLTLRAGGFPAVYLLFSWGGREGMHTAARVDTSLLGATSRPSL